VDVWYLSIATTTLQAVLSLWLLRREFGKRLVAFVPGSGEGAPGPEQRRAFSRGG
jgi:hypothetical protein